MTSARRWIKDGCYALARRTLEQRRRLAPSPEVNEALNYLLLRECQENRDHVEVTAFCALSNHHHLLVTDLQGGADSKVSELCRDFHATLAKTLNALHGRSGVVWDPGRSFNQVEVHGFQAEVAQWVYVAGQAVAAGLVEAPEDWPGICWLPEDVGRTLTAKRPDVLFSTAVLEEEEEEGDDEALRHARERLAKRSRDDKKRGRSRSRRKQLAKERERRGRRAAPETSERRQPRSSLPETVSYTVPVPRCFRDWDDLEEVRLYLRAALNLYVHEIHERRRAQGLGFLGVEALHGQDPLTPPPQTQIATDSPATYRRAPGLATRGLDEGEVRAIKDDRIQWSEDYEEALDLLLRSPTPQRARFPQGAHLRAQEQRRILAAYRAQPPPRAA